jgi:hypothetical protein
MFKSLTIVSRLSHAMAFWLGFLELYWKRLLMFLSLLNLFWVTSGNMRFNWIAKMRSTVE